MTQDERNTLNAALASLESALQSSASFGKATYSQGRAIPSTANHIQSAIMLINELLNAPEQEVTHVTHLVTSDAVSNVIAKEVARVSHASKPKA